MPEGTPLKMVSADTFKKYKEALSGLTEENVAAVTAKLVQLGLAGHYQPGGGGTGQSGSYHPG